MTAEFKILGVYPIKAQEPCHMFEVLVPTRDRKSVWNGITQELAGVPRSDWQAVYDEQLLDEDGENSHYVFFFHYLDFSKPLMTPYGNILLPKPKERPEELNKIEYYPVD